MHSYLQAHNKRTDKKPPSTAMLAAYIHIFSMKIHMPAWKWMYFCEWRSKFAELIKKLFLFILCSFLSRPSQKKTLQMHVIKWIFFIFIQKHTNQKKYVKLERNRTYRDFLMQSMYDVTFFEKLMDIANFGKNRVCIFIFSFLHSVVFNWFPKSGREFKNAQKPTFLFIIQVPQYAHNLYISSLSWMQRMLFCEC